MSLPAVQPPHADHVIGVFPREGLSSALAATHRAGFGPQTRVIDGARGGIGPQLERLGPRGPWSEEPPTDAVLIVVTAPGRAEIVAALFERLGAESVVFAARRTMDSLVPERARSLAPDIRIGESTGASSEA